MLTDAFRYLPKPIPERLSGAENSVREYWFSKRGREKPRSIVSNPVNT
jgi:hypothetical protein